MDETAERRRTQKVTFKNIPIEKLRRGAYQPRLAFSKESLNALADTIKLQGILEPLLVRELPIPDNYEIIAGERRWQAAQIARMEEVPCLIRQYSNRDASQIALIENISRESLNPIEEAMALKSYIDEFNYTYQEICIIFRKKNRSEICNKLRLLDPDPRVQKMLIAGELLEGHGKTLAGIDVMHQYTIARQCVDNHWSMRKMEEVIKKQYSAKKNKNGCLSSKKDTYLVSLERKISDAFGHSVEIDFNKEKQSGFVRIPYQNLRQFGLIAERMGYKGDKD